MDWTVFGIKWAICSCTALIITIFWVLSARFKTKIFSRFFESIKEGLESRKMWERKIANINKRHTQLEEKIEKAQKELEQVRKNAVSREMKMPVYEDPIAKEITRRVKKKLDEFRQSHTRFKGGQVYVDMTSSEHEMNFQIDKHFPKEKTYGT